MPQPNNNILIRDSKQFQFLNERNECKRGGFVCRIEEVPPLGRIVKRRGSLKEKWPSNAIIQDTRGGV
jgi:hypothetical protein